MDETHFVINMDNGSYSRFQRTSQKIQEALAAENTLLWYFPPVATHLVQPTDSFVISKIKDAWTRIWECKETDPEMIKAREWSDTVRKDGAFSGKLKNPGKG
ncbi:hypothetical protein R1sor_000585 [Riccia sorocarpa]|uniref:DDE-1 domain-containing protein n=1 Tax=Riccia sorocarpa TaxID=122646 RepID=A0ABD3GTK1_9MARC